MVEGESSLKVSQRLKSGLAKVAPLTISIVPLFQGNLLYATIIALLIFFRKEVRVTGNYVVVVVVIFLCPQPGAQKRRKIRRETSFYIAIMRLIALSHLSLVRDKSSKENDWMKDYLDKEVV